jgi:hypothetical protein
MQAEQLALLDGITTKGVSEMLLVALDAVDPVYIFLRGLL